MATLPLCSVYAVEQELYGTARVYVQIWRLAARQIFLSPVTPPHVGAVHSSLERVGTIYPGPSQAIFGES